MKVEIKLYDTHAHYVTVATTKKEIEEAIEKLRVSHIIGHNVLGFDLEVLNRLYGLEVPVDQVTDTLILSRLIYPDIRQEDAAVKRLEPRLWGSHSLEAWGCRLNHNKGNFGNSIEDFKELSEEMVDYCINDVDLTNILWKNLRAKLPPEKSVRLEHNIANICYQQEKNGFAFNEEQAIKLYSRLSKRRDELSKQLKEVFGSWLINEGLRRNELYSKIKIVDFNPNSRKHIAKRLKELRGWEPKEFTPSGEAKVDEAILKKLKYPEAKLMSEYLMINKRIGQLAEGDQAWLKLVKQGRLHGRVNTMGASTSRASHSNPNLAQVPNTNAPYGKDCRSLFIPNRGQKLLGIDVSGLELRCLSHYLAKYDNGTYGKKLLEEDIHTVNQEAAGLATRDQAKTFIYGFLYGAGDQKIGEIVGKGRREGRLLKTKFLSQLPALKSLRKAVQEKAVVQGTIRGLDGRIVPVRSKHAALNTLLQSAGAIICKQWVVEMHSLLNQKGFKRGEDYDQVAFVHDEVQLTVKEEHAREIGRLCVEAITTTGIGFGLRIPLSGEYSIGETWAETH
jgi:DNA polymerase I-like protein with 3'-5' exonuclease and polymerase domains